MPYQVVQPPADQERFAQLGKELFERSKELGMTLDVEGFLMAWVNGTRVVVERNADGLIVSMALVAMGKQWVRNRVTASIMELRTYSRENRDAMVEFITQLATAMGASSLYLDMDLTQEQPGKRIYTVLEIMLQ